ncbi:hypothetical protein BL250_16245 [Erwinia sp. OLTSP20]|nr:hypothetical protein BV501_14320 [Erwinia sp. OAMSP11]PIJ74541.1 hypothetical protein BK416_03525 [Erwinia sp. OLSSP12]PIJ79572.1 hypothetical protein BLD47_12945 [Erwinia sp. OLCASP19]PIJ80357.1 hypothetical protein BLD46_14790 [Erwinia sp. OLMTSP26]PIJ82472.1 hypothetical protein BLD49_14685 [Erwinia sp. OLMDSP33]PIJ88773.1 hypothetical protein BL250_16245 [Erwinia sp. OLTSP20]PIJ91551.1 hypothetical protein BL249_09420 [Erwinia sp. OLFS4]
MRPVITAGDPKDTEEKRLSAASLACMNVSSVLAGKIRQDVKICAMMALFPPGFNPLNRQRNGPDSLIQVSRQATAHRHRKSGLISVC